MRKAVILLLFTFSLCFCSFFRSKTSPYPTGIIFPLEKAGEIAYEGQIIEHMQKRGKNLYFSTRKGFVYCLDGVERKILWTFQSDGPLTSAAYLGQENVYVFDRNSTLYCLHKDGRLDWKKKIEEKITSGVRENKGKIYFGTEKGGLFALDMARGERLWRFQAGDAIRSTPFIYDRGMLVFGCDDHYFYFLSDKGSEIDKFEAGDKIQSSPLVDGNFVYFGSDDHHFYCLDLKKRRRKWRVKTGGKILSAPFSDEKRVLFLCWNGVLYCLNKKKGTILWWRAIPSRSFYEFEIIDDRIVVSSLSSILVCFDIETGDKIGDYKASEELKSNPLWEKPHLLINLYDFRKKEGSLVFLKKEVKVTLTPSKQSPQKRGEELIFTASATGFFRPTYEFYLNRLTKAYFNSNFFIFVREGKKEIVQEKSEENTWAWFPEKDGIYVTGVEVVDEKEKAETEIFFVIEKEEVKVSLVPSKESPQEIDEEIIFNASARGFHNPKYEFYLNRLNKVDFNSAFFILITEWDKKLVQEKSEKNSWTWLPEKPGAYVVEVKITDEREMAETRISFEIKKKADKKK